VRVAWEETGLELDAAGSARAARDLRRALEARGDIELVPVAQPRRRGAAHAAPLAAGAGFPGSEAARVLRGLSRELTWFPVRLPVRVRRLRADVLHCPLPVAPPLPHPTPTLVAVGDALAWERPEWFPRALGLHARFVLAPALRRAAAVLVPSEHTRERLLASVRGLSEQRVRVTPWGIDARFAPGPGRAGPYLLTVGTLQPRKNLEAAISAFERLGGDHRLVVAGAWGWHGDALRSRLARSPARAAIDVLGRVSDDDLLALYRGADCLLFPSRGEGFGFPPLEAMACGTPVVAAAAGSLPEVLGDAAPLVDPDDPAALAAAVADVLRDPDPWRARGRECAAAYSWERCAELTVAAYEAALR
jgi:alpha-1,3-rhamnosyl/mannosyltransferase